MHDCSAVWRLTPEVLTTCHLSSCGVTPSFTMDFYHRTYLRYLKYAQRQIIKVQFFVQTEWKLRFPLCPSEKRQWLKRKCADCKGGINTAVACKKHPYCYRELKHGLSLLGISDFPRLPAGRSRHNDREEDKLLSPDLELFIKIGNGSNLARFVQGREVARNRMFVAELVKPTSLLHRILIVQFLCR